MIRAWIFFGAVTLVLGSPVSHSQRGEVGNAVRTHSLPKFDPNDVYFYLWTKDNPSSYESIRPGQTASNFNNGRQTKVIAHGWNQNGLSGFVKDMKDAFLSQGDYNVISIDWGVDAASIDYFTSAYAVVNVGSYAASLIDSLVASGANIKDFHIIGFSLGAHVAGATGAAVSGSVSRISGLDPAYPAFSMDNTDRRLDTSDADFVDVMHTNTGTLAEGGLSFPDPLGHVDFFPNGGHEQPGCFDNISDIIDMISGCSHGRAPKYYIESIRSSAFQAKKCSSYDEYLAGSCSSNAGAAMGYGVSTGARGNFYLQTNDNSPYAQG
ncbi:pancreatic triacylglycerol lipase-like [Artemia franciscana]|uniref:pancreatic triacylglycerol lipase-like n=1 Tax=Artemia franciscana TaxID=6661 RepID=UPI0032DB57C6